MEELKTFRQAEITYIQQPMVFMKTLSDIREAVLRKVKPGPSEERKLSDFSEKLKSVADAYMARIDGEAMICGSTGKGTWLRGDHDIDLFLVSPRGADLSEVLEFAKLIVSEMKGEWKLSYAQHPYLQARINGYKVDLVPCYRISKGEKPVSAVDRSPLHLAFVLENLSEKQRDDVRVLKAFMKSIGAYGSDLRHQGISGYVIEVMVARFGSMEKVLEFLGNARYGASLPERPARRFNDPLVVIDPVDENRNTAAALSASNFSRIRFMSSSLLSKPSLRFFRKKHGLTSSEKSRIRKRGTIFVSLKFTRPDRVDDILYPQARKLMNKIRKKLESMDFRIYSWFEYCDRYCHLTYELSVSNVQRIFGPPCSSRIHASRFSAMHPVIAEKDGRLVSYRMRDWKKTMISVAKEHEGNGFRFLGMESTEKLMDDEEFGKAMRLALFLDMPLQ